MGYIYCITNLLNNKRYIGKTTKNPEERFKEHCVDSQKKRCEKRPLYDAMNKYGIENFRLDVLESGISQDVLSQREIFWIKELQTFGSGGYNATCGGDGKILYDYHEIVDLLNLGYSSAQVCNKIGCCSDIVYKVAKMNSIKIRKGDSKVVLQYDLAGNYIQTFLSIQDAMNWLVEHGLAKNKTATSKITNCCKHKAKTAFKYKWEYGNLPE